jgi:hypothetical protein
VEADDETDDEAGDGDAGTGLDAGGATKPRRRIRSAVGKQSTSAVAAAISATKAAEKKKKRKRKAPSPPAVVMPTILTPRSREVELKDQEEEEEEKEKDKAIEELLVTGDRPARRSESPAAKRQRELVEKTSEDALRRGLETQRTTAATQAKMPAAIRPRVFRLKLQIPISAR